MAWLDLHEGVAALFGEWQEHVDAIVGGELERRAHHRREHEAELAADRLQRFKLRNPGYWKERAARAKAARPARRCARCGATLPATAHGRRKYCEGVCELLGPFVVVLDRPGRVDRSPPIGELRDAARVAVGAAAVHQAEARIEASGTVVARYVEGSAA